MANQTNNLVVENARGALDQLKLETATELGLSNYGQIYKGDLPSRVNGSVGGYMTKKLVALAEQQLSQTGGFTSR
jgi:small acid-soluble spore protein A (major alpha-type SASP)